jgi:hypothetical protein
MKKIIILLILQFFIFGVFLAPNVLANGLNLSNTKEILDNAAGPDGAGYNLEFNSPEPVIAVIIKAFLSFLGVLFLILMIYGGFLWMTARGNEAQVTKSKDLMTAAVIGLIIILISYAISYFVVDALTKSTLKF